MSSLSETSVAAFSASSGVLRKVVNSLSLRGPKAEDPTAQVLHTLLLALLAWTIFTAYMLLASLRTTMVLSVVFAFLFATFLLLAIGFLAAPPNATVIHAGGWLGLITAALAWYHSAAGVTSASLGRTLLPVFPWKK